MLPCQSFLFSLSIIVFVFEDDSKKCLLLRLSVKYDDDRKESILDYSSTRVGGIVFGDTEAIHIVSLKQIITGT